jgi:glycosyltransferase involved in cell wall biosynthesis
MNLSFIDKLILRVVQRSGKLAIAPISLELEKSLKKSWFNFDQTKMIFSPMAVPDSFFGEKSRIFLEDKNNITLSYVGSLYSTGYDQKIVDLIRCIEKINSQFPSRKIKFELFGIENELIPMLENKFRDMKLKGLLNINPRDLHENLIPKLRACDVFILPYPDGVFFRNRFPLKALEYAALFRPIFVTDTTSHRNIFNDEEVWFYKQGDCLELGNALMKLNLNSNETQLKLEAAYAKASKHKYSARVNKILKVISLNNN